MVAVLLLLYSLETDRISVLWVNMIDSIRNWWTENMRSMSSLKHSCLRVVSGTEVISSESTILCRPVMLFLFLDFSYFRRDIRTVSSLTHWTWQVRFVTASPWLTLSQARLHLTHSSFVSHCWTTPPSEGALECLGNHPRTEASATCCCTEICAYLRWCLHRMWGLHPSDHLRSKEEDQKEKGEGPVGQSTVPLLRAGLKTLYLSREGWHLFYGDMLCSNVKNTFTHWHFAEYFF